MRRGNNNGDDDDVRNHSDDSNRGARRARRHRNSDSGSDGDQGRARGVGRGGGPGRGQPREGGDAAALREEQRVVREQRQAAKREREEEAARVRAERQAAREARASAKAHDEEGRPPAALTAASLRRNNDGGAREPDGSARGGRGVGSSRGGKMTAEEKAAAKEERASDRQRQREARQAARAEAKSERSSGRSAKRRDDRSDRSRSDRRSRRDRSDRSGAVADDATLHTADHRGSDPATRTVELAVPDVPAVLLALWSSDDWTAVAGDLTIDAEMAPAHAAPSSSDDSRSGSASDDDRHAARPMGAQGEHRALRSRPLVVADPASSSLSVTCSAGDGPSILRRLRYVLAEQADHLRSVPHELTLAGECRVVLGSGAVPPSASSSDSSAPPAPVCVDVGTRCTVHVDIQRTSAPAAAVRAVLAAATDNAGRPLRYRFAKATAQSLGAAAVTFATPFEAACGTEVLKAAFGRAASVVRVEGALERQLRAALAVKKEGTMLAAAASPLTYNVVATFAAPRDSMAKFPPPVVRMAYEAIVRLLCPDYDPALEVHPAARGGPGGAGRDHDERPPRARGADGGGGGRGDRREWRDDRREGNSKGKGKGDKAPGPKPCYAVFKAPGLRCRCDDQLAKFQITASGVDKSTADVLGSFSISGTSMKIKSTMARQLPAPDFVMQSRGLQALVKSAASNQHWAPRAPLLTKEERELAKQQGPQGRRPKMERPPRIDEHDQAVCMAAFRRGAAKGRGDDSSSSDDSDDEDEGPRGIILVSGPTAASVNAGIRRVTRQLEQSVTIRPEGPLVPAFFTDKGRSACNDLPAVFDTTNRSVSVFGGRDAAAAVQRTIADFFEHWSALSPVSVQYPLRKGLHKRTMAQLGTAVRGISKALRDEVLSIRLRSGGVDVFAAQSVHDELLRRCGDALVNPSDPEVPVAADDDDDDDGDNDAMCPLCFMPPEQPVRLLSCAHVFCRECLANMFKASSEGGEPVALPIRCPADGCGERMALSDVLLLDPAVAGRLAESARAALLSAQEPSAPIPQVAAAPDDDDDGVNASAATAYSECPNKLCTALMVATFDNPKRRFCSGCAAEFCALCFERFGELEYAEPHDGACPTQRVCASKNVKVVVELLNTRCPRCSDVIFDFNGCFAVTCGKCKCGFCGFCMKDCGSDAHSHAIRCDRGCKSYFSTREHFFRLREEDAVARVMLYLRAIKAQEVVFHAVQEEVNRHHTAVKFSYSIEDLRARTFSPKVPVSLPPALLKTIEQNESAALAVARPTATPSADVSTASERQLRCRALLCPAPATKSVQAKAAPSTAAPEPAPILRSDDGDDDKEPAGAPEPELFTGPLPRDRIDNVVAILKLAAQL